MTYKCSACDTVRPRDSLVAVRKQWLTLGLNGKVLRTRVVAWLCTVGDPSCLDKDPGFSQESYVGAPGSSAKRSAQGVSS